MPDDRLQRTREIYAEPSADQIVQAVKQMPDGRFAFMLTPGFAALVEQLREEKEQHRVSGVYSVAITHE